MGKLFRQNRENNESPARSPAWREGGRIPADARPTADHPAAEQPAATLAPGTLQADAPRAALRAQAVHTASQIIAARLGLIEGVRDLREHLSRLGEFEAGEFSGDFAALSFFAFETDPYPSESERATWSAQALAEADRWVPTLLARHRAKVLEACHKVLDKFQK